MKKILFMCIFLLVLLSACNQQLTTDNNIGTNDKTNTANDQLYCTADVKECPDGSFVARNPEKNCEFEECLGEEKNY